MLYECLIRLERFDPRFGDRMEAEVYRVRSSLYYLFGSAACCGRLSVKTGDWIRFEAAKQ